MTTKHKTPDTMSIYESLCKFQSQLTTVEKNRQGYNFKYADLTDIWDMMREPLANNGFSIVQLVQSEDNATYIITKLIHVSGECIESKTLMNFSAKKFQDVGTAITYYRRYALSAMIGIVSDDDVDAKQHEGDKDVYEPQKPLPPKIRYIDANQLKIIETLINGHEDIRSKMLGVYTSLNEIPADAFDNVIKSINVHLKDKEKTNDC